MTDLHVIAAALAAACREAGVDPAVVFAHLDPADIAAYERYIGDPNLPTYMLITLRTIQRGRCTCSRCREVAA